jgi:hypothetical protein
MALTNAYGTLAELLEQVSTAGQVGPGPDWNDRLERAGNAAARQIDAHCGRRFWQDGTVVAREFYADSAYECCVDDISTTTGLIVKTDTAGDGTFATTLTIGTDFIVQPSNAADRTPVWPYTELVIPASSTSYFPECGRRPGVQVTAKFGWPAVPDDVAMAWLLRAGNLFDGNTADTTWQSLLEPYVKVYA